MQVVPNLNHVRIEVIPQRMRDSIEVSNLQKKN